MKLELADRWAVVTGASSGIGAEFARQLAARGMHLLLTARRQDRLETLAQQLFQEFGTKTVLVQLDLAAPGACEELIHKIRELPLPLTLLVNNAGFGSVASIEHTDPQRILGIVDLNIRVLTQLTYEFLPDFIRRKEGGIINVASVVAFQPVAYMSGYAASKAYVLHLTEGLWAELQDHQVRMLALCPGTTRTEFFDEAGISHWLKSNSSHTPAQVVSAALKSYERNRPVCVPGWKNWIMTLLPRLTFRKLVVKETKRLFEKVVRQSQTPAASRTDTPSHS